MKKRYFAATVLSLLIFITQANAQRTEISIGLSEHFFDTVIDAIFQNGEPPEFSISSNRGGFDSVVPDARRTSITTNYPHSFIPASTANCRQSIRLSREIAGVRTAVRFRDGKVIAPMAFNGSYNPPLVGCIDFSGWAETTIELRFDQENQRLVAEAKVQKVHLSGANGIGSELIGKMVQSAIDRKINPIELINTEKVSFVLPIQNSGNLKMRAVGIKPEIVNGVLLVRIEYEFVKA